MLSAQPEGPLFPVTAFLESPSQEAGQLHIAQEALLPALLLLHLSWRQLAALDWTLCLCFKLDILQSDI